MTHNSPVIVKLIHFQLEIKVCHQGTNLETFKCSGENLPNSSCQFLETQASFPSNFVSISSAIKHNSSKCQRTNQSANFLGFLVLGSKFSKFLSLLKQKISFSSNFVPLFGIMRHNSSMLFSLKLYILSAKVAYQSTNLVKFHLSS